MLKAAAAREVARYGFAEGKVMCLLVGGRLGWGLGMGREMSLHPCLPALPAPKMPCLKSFHAQCHSRIPTTHSYVMFMKMNV